MKCSQSHETGCGGCDWQPGASMRRVSATIPWLYRVAALPKLDSQFATAKHLSSTIFYLATMLSNLHRNLIHSHTVISASHHHTRGGKNDDKCVPAISHATLTHDCNNIKCRNSHVDKPRSAASVVSAEAPSHELLHVSMLHKETLQKAHDYDSYLTKLPV